MVQILKLQLQRRQLTPANMSPLIFGDEYEPEAELSIIELRQRIENLGVPTKKSTQLARYLVEAPHQTEMVFNENAKASCAHVLDTLKGLIG